MVPLDHADSAVKGYQSAVPVKRSESLGIFILDSLVTAGHELRKRHLQAYDKHLLRLDERLDRDLKKPFEAAEARAKQMKNQKYSKFSDELDTVMAHVRDVQTIYQRFWASATPQKRTKGSTRKELDAGASDVARRFAEGPPDCHTFLTPNLGAIKASYAYTLSPSFGFAMAYRDLCTIKAIASEHVPTARSFAETMSIAPSFLRGLGENGDE